MKIGILTFHRAHNYGAVLQCYALKETLRAIGHDAYVIDYRQPDIEKIYSFRPLFGIRSFLKSILNGKFSYVSDHISLNRKRAEVASKKRCIFEQFQNEHLSLSAVNAKTIPSDFDAYVIGSDMVWSDDCMLGHFEPYYLGEFKHKKTAKVIGYAISGSLASFDKLASKDHFAFLKNFTACSFREKTLAEIVEKQIGKEVQKCIDPTLLTERKLWNSILNNEWKERKRYILLYYLRLKADERLCINRKAEKYAQEHGYDIVYIDMSATTNPITVQDFVSSICYAQHVITDSFHGIIFSMIFHRSFQAIRMNDSHDTRYVDILQKLQISNTIFPKDLEIKLLDIDYEKVDRSITEYRSSSLEFLHKNL